MSPPAKGSNGSTNSGTDGGREQESNAPIDSTAASMPASALAATTPPSPMDLQRRQPSTLPGLSATASTIRTRRSSNQQVPQVGSMSGATSGTGLIGPGGGHKPSSLRRVSSGRDDDAVAEEELSRADVRATMDPSQLEEIRKGIIMPGLGGNRAVTADPSAARPGLSSNSSTSSASDATGRAQANAIPNRTTASQNVPASGPISAIPHRGPNPASNVPELAPPPSRSRAQPMLKASMLKKRINPPTAVVKAGTTGAGKASTGPKIGQGTPARATRYSLPVRAEKPVRTSKTTGKHVVLPSESQLAPLPDEEEEEEEESSSSSEEESDLEVASRADDELASDLDEEEREKAQEAARRRREEAQRRIDELRRQRDQRRQAKQSEERAARAASQGRGPAHARAPPRVPKASGPVYHTFERLPPAARLHTPLPRLTSYAIAPAIHLPTLIGFLRREHGVRPRLYDECAYVVYFKPLLPGFGRAEVRSAPEPRHGSPGAESRREREIVEREESGYVGGYFAATNRDDEGDHIDEQGYIMGGEGRGQEEDEAEQAERRRKQEANDGNRGGDVTETETEREGEREDRRLRMDFSETEAENEGEAQRDDEASPLLPSRIAEEDREQDGQDEAGSATPRALQPRNATEEETEAMKEAILDLEEAKEETQEQMAISHADRAGARDLRDQQHRIEAGDLETSDMPIMRSADSDREEQGQGLGNGSQDRDSLRDDRPRVHRNNSDEPRYQRKKRLGKRSRPSGPNVASHNHDTSANMLTSRSIFEALQTAELVILPYGVLVMYNMSAHEERSIINDVISSGCIRGGPSLGADGEETEAFHFCYDPSVPAPRIFNDFFTFRASNHLLKLSLAHAIAQSTKLSVFEESMQQTLELTSHIPKELASSGELQLKRREALKLTGRLFKLRVDVNLTSNVLDTPELFWSEASLKALYDAIREYLEIDQRVENLNERLAVGNDLLEVIHDHISSQSMNQITWIIIILIVVACIVACGEILARLVLHGRTRTVQRALERWDGQQWLELTTALLQLPAPGSADTAATLPQIDAMRAAQHAFALPLLN